MLALALTRIASLLPWGCRCLDISSSRCKLALIDEASNVVVYDLNTKVGHYP